MIIFRRNLHDYEQGVTNKCNHITVRFNYVIETFCELRIVSFGSGFEFLGRLLISLLLMGIALQATEYPRLCISTTTAVY